MQGANENEVTQAFAPDARPFACARYHDAQALLPVVYEELRRLAQQQLADERTGHTLQATALVHEAFIRLARGRGDGWLTQQQFFVAAADAMRKILIDHARCRGRLKRAGSRRRVPLDLVCAAAEMDHEEILELDDLIQKLEKSSEQAAAVVRLRFYGGLSVDQTAAALDVSPSTVDRAWTSARVWLWRQWTAHVA